VNLTRRQQEIYDFIRSYQSDHGYPPHVIEIQAQFHYKAHSTVVQHLKALEKKGVLKVAYKQKRGIHLLEPGRRNRMMLPLRGVVPAGAMVECYEDYEEISLQDHMVASLDNTYVLQIRGDSMIDEHIMDGDMVLIEERSYAKDGQIVVACYEGQMTLKKYFREKDHIRLQPANPTMETIRVYGDVQVLGVMVGLMRRMTTH